MLTHYIRLQNGSAHEFLIFEVYDGEKVVMLRVERRPSGRKADNAWFTSLKSVAEDSISRESKFNAKEYSSICDVPCGPPLPIISLVDICNIFEKIRHQSPEYKLRSQQCYWFCSMFLKRLSMLPGLSDIRLMRGPDYELKGRYMGCFRFRVLNSSQIDKDIEDYLRQERQKEEVDDAEEKERIRKSVVGAVTQHKSQARKKRRRIKAAVTPHLKSAATIEELEAQAVRDALTKISVDARGKRKLEGMDKVGMARKFMSQLRERVADEL